MTRDLLTILGPTALGKTKLATHTALLLGAEIVSADSRMVYRGMDIGTGKDLQDYTIEGRTVPHHLIDIAQAGHRFSVYEFLCAFQNAFMDITARGRLPLLCGGTGLYIEAALKGYSLGPVQFPQRNSLVIGLTTSRELRRERITRRLEERLAAGLVDEVRTLLLTLTPERLMRYGLEYKYVTLYCTGQLSYADMFSRLNTAIHQFAKRQMTWFRGMEQRRGTPIHWLDAEQDPQVNAQTIASLWNAGE